MRPKAHAGASYASVALLIAFFFLACHGAPGVIHQSAHLEASGTYHGAASHAGAGHIEDESKAQGSQPRDAAQNGSGMSDNYAAALLVLAFGGAALIAAARAVRRAPWAIMSRWTAPPRPRWRPPPPPTPVRLQVFRL